ncbi:TonB family protein [Granulicella sibirica]|uniref:Ferric siderophore transport system, periplasmic binding protein TonB n=1 Tax=Granulicella sibirica TaxID=2479048 RepID=A0A4Q0T3K7_9BACT|nr:TonB family protein [Granulicella sibirica]RXH56569.1 Ferric siderophore transport system, periplasmic binding protein TonB [Granulicella sibirica]
MATQPSNWSRSSPIPRPNTGVDLAWSIVLHAAIAGVLVGYAYLHIPHGKTWGDSSPTAGAIQATMVATLPLPPKQPVKEDNVLASETPSPAPVVEKEKTIPPPNPKDIPVVVKTPPKTKPVKVAEKQADPIKHPELKPPPPTKATTGETSGMRIAQATIQLKNGTASVTVQDRSFGARFAYYVEAVNRRVSQNWYTQEADPRASQGKRTTVLFDIDREGTPSNVRVENRSGSPSLDTSAVRAVQRVDGFGPLPQGDHITVEFSFDYKQ